MTRGIVVILSFVNIFILVRIVTKESFGSWVLFTSIVALLEMTRQGFIKNPFITNWTTADAETRSHILSSSLILNASIASIFGLLIYFGAPALSSFWHSHELTALLTIYIFQSFLMIPYFYFDCLLTVRLDFKAIFFCELVRQGAQSLFLLWIYWSHTPFQLTTLAWIQLGAAVLATIVAHLYLRSHFTLDLKLSKKQLTHLFHFGKYTFGTNVCSMVIKNTDTWTLAKFATPAAVAIYNPALRIANIFEVPAVAVANMVFPKVGKKMRKEGKQGIRQLYEQSVSLMLALILPVAVPIILFAETIVTLIFGPAYIDTAPILQITMLYFLIIPFNRQFGTVMDGLKKPKLNFVFLVATVFVNVALNYAGFHFFGVIGCAIGTLTSFCLVFIANQFVLNKTFEISVSGVLRKIPDWYSVLWTTAMKQVIAIRQA